MQILMPLGIMETWFRASLNGQYYSSVIYSVYMSQTYIYSDVCPQYPSAVIHDINIIVLWYSKGFQDLWGSPWCRETSASRTAVRLYFFPSLVCLFIYIYIYIYICLRVSEANEVPISSHIWVGLSTFNWL